MNSQIVFLKLLKYKLYPVATRSVGVYSLLSVRFLREAMQWTST